MKIGIGSISAMIDRRSELDGQNGLIVLPCRMEL